MHRRTLLRAGLLSSALLPGLGGLARAAGFSPPRATVTVLTGLRPDRSGRHLAAILNSFGELNLPIACILENERQPRADATGDESVAAVLGGLKPHIRPLIELCAFHSSLAGMVPYEMARAAQETRAALIDTLRAAPGPGSLPKLASIACDETEKPLAPSGLVAAGMPICLVLPQETGLVKSEIWENGSLRIFGGSRADIETAGAVLGHGAGGQFADLHFLSLPDLEQGSPERAAQRAAAYARIALDRELEGRIVNLPLSDLLLRDNFDFSRTIGLHLFRPAPDQAALMASFEKLKHSILDLGFSFSESARNSVRTGREVNRLWIPRIPDSADPAPRSVPLEAVLTDPARWPGGVRLDGGAYTAAGVGVELVDMARSNPGIDRFAGLRVPAVSVDNLLSDPSRLEDILYAATDFVLTISSDAIATTPRRLAIPRLLQAIDQGGYTRIGGLDQFTSTRYPSDALITRFQNVQAAASDRRPPRRSRWDRLRRDFLEDAKHAWAYVERFTDPVSGLCPSVVDTFGGKETKLETVTMWDVASLINGVLAARRLGLIERDEFNLRIARILPNLRGRVTDDVRLPQEWIRTDRVKWGNRNFDACDSGRLLAALGNLRRDGAFDAEIDEVVGGWDLDRIIVEGIIHSVKDRELVTIQGSHCAHYAVRAFRKWGYDAVSPYEVLDGRSAADGRMRLLEVANRMGIFGAEPLLLEANDFGLSPESAYLADVLFAAQVESHDRTGQLVCVSESPLDRQPWFVYQGIALDRLKDEWQVSPASENEKFLTDEAGAQLMSLSCKAAFLWAANRPHAYSDLLVSFVRARGKTDIGFVPGIYSRSGEPMTSYSDLNTNTIILQSIELLLARDTAP